MFETKKQLKKEIKGLNREIESLKQNRDIADDLRKIAEGEMRLSKANHKLCVDRIKELEADIADRMRYTAELEEMVTELDEENDRLAGIVGEYQQGLARNTEKLKTAILENKELKEKIKTLNDIIKNAKLNLTVKDNEKCKLVKSIIEKNTEIIELKDKNNELHSNVVSLVAQNEDLNKKIQKYYEYEKSFRKQLKEKDAEISSLKTQNEIQRAVIEDAWNDNVIIEEEKTITFYTQEGEKTYPLIFKK